MNFCHENRIIEIIKDDYEYFMKMKNVVGVAMGYKESDGKYTDEIMLKVLVTKKEPSKKLHEDDRVPKVYKGVRTDVQAVGVMTACANGMLTARIRPVPPGYSVGQVDITAGTIGTIVFGGEGVDTRIYILSNNHVLANSNRAEIGSPIVQPGPIDGGSAATDTIATLADFVPIQFESNTRSPENIVDCAIGLTTPALVARAIYYEGVVRESANANLGDSVYKTGRTTGYTVGEVTMTNATVRVAYGGSQTALFVNQCISVNMGAGGDSGSLIINDNGKAVGLLFAGSGEVTIFNPIETVLEQLGVRLR